MDAQEVRDRLKNVFVSMVKDDQDAAKAELHDVLAAKMRDRINPPAAEAVDGHDDNIDVETDEVPIDDDVEVD
jgi:hypothetical protein